MPKRYIIIIITDNAAAGESLPLHWLPQNHTVVRSKGWSGIYKAVQNTADSSIVTAGNIYRDACDVEDGSRVSYLN